MQSIVRKAVRPFTVVLKGIILVLIICATGGAWAVDSLEETGGFVTTTPQIAFKGVKLRDIRPDTVAANITGGNIDHKNARARFCNFTYSADYTTATCEAQSLDGSNIKGLLLTFAQAGNDVTVCATDAKYLPTSSAKLGYTIANGTSRNIVTDETSDGYGLHGFRRLTTYPTDNRATVTWETGEFKTSKTGTDGQTYSIELNDNTVDDSDQNIHIGSATTKGVTISLPTGPGQVMVLVQYTAPSGGAPVANSVIASAKSNYDIGAICTSAAGTTVTGYYYDNGIANNNGSYYGLNNPPIADGDGYFVFSFQAGANGTAMFAGTSLTSLSGGQNSTLKWAGKSNTSIAIGGPNVEGDAKPWGGLVIKKIALFVDNCIANQAKPMLATYQWPSEYTSSDYTNWNYTPDILTWIDVDRDIGGSANDALQLFLRGTGADSTVKVGRGGNTDYNGSYMWHNFCCNQGAYKAPGLTLRIKDASRKIQAGFNAYQATIQGAFTLGGLIVESTAEGCQLQGNNSTKGLATILGSTDGSETWFGIKANAAVSRTGYLLLSGNVNIDVADGKVFTLNNDGNTQSTAAYYPVLVGNITNTTTGTGCVGGKLTMHGEGQINAVKLTAAGSYLDYSTLNGRVNTNPFIDATLVVDEKTTYAFPADVAGGSSYRLATALDGSDATRDTVFSVGSHTYTAPLTFNASSGTVDFPAVATVAEGDLTNPKLWADITWDAKPATIDNATPVVINVDDNTYLASTTALSLGSLTFNIAEGKTLLFVPSQGLTTANGFTVTGGGTLKIAMNTLITGDMTIADDVTLAYYAESDSLKVNGTLTVASGKTLTLAPVAISGATATIVTATTLTVDGTLAVTAPDSDNTYTIDTATTSNSVILKRTPNPAYTYNASITNPDTSGFDSFGNNTRSNYRIGPNSDYALVSEISSGYNPYVSFTKHAGSFTWSIYADVSQMLNVSDSGTEGKRVMLAVGNNAGNVTIYREGNYVKAANVTAADGTIQGEVSVAATDGFHLYTVVYDSEAKTLTLYKDDGQGSGNKNVGAQIELAMNDGFQIGSTHSGLPTTFWRGEKMAFAAVRGFNKLLSDGEVANLAEGFPAVDISTISRDITFNQADKTLTIYSLTSSNQLNVNGGTVVIPANETVSFSKLWTFTDGSSTSANAITVNGTLNITAEDPSAIELGCGISLGYWISQTSGARTSVINVPTGGTINAPNAYIHIPWANNTASGTLNVSGGTVKAKGLYAYHPNTSSVLGHVTITSGGVLELSEQVDSNRTIEKTFGYGTYRVKGTGTEKGSITFNSSNSSQPTTLDPYGATLTLNGMADSGYITVADSYEGTKGSVVFVGTGGDILLTDANYSLIDISGYTGSITYQGTTAATLAKLNGFAGTVYFTESVDASAINLSGATVNVADGCTYTATARQEGAMVLGTGATATLKVTDDIFNYEGYVPVVSGSGSVNYYKTSASAAIVNTETETYTIGNNLLPYYYVWETTEGGSAGIASGETSGWGRMDDGTRPVNGKNVAFHVQGETTVNVDEANVSYATVQAYGSGTLKFSGANALTVATQFVVEEGVTLEYDTTKLTVSSIEVDDGAELAVVGGTEVSPIAITADIAGEGTLRIASGAVSLNHVNRNFTGDIYIMPGARAVSTVATDNTATGFGRQGTTITVYVGGQLDVAGTSGVSHNLVIDTDPAGGEGDYEAAIVNTGNDIGKTERQACSLTVNTSATIDCSHTWGILASSHGATTLALAKGVTLTKTGTGTFLIASATIHNTGSGVTNPGIDIAQGTVEIVSQGTSTACTLATGATLDVMIRDNATMNVNKGFAATNLGVSGNGTVNVSSSGSLALSAAHGAGTVKWTGKQPGGDVWKTSAGWTGTNVVMSSETTEITDLRPDNWGREGSFIVMKNLKGYLGNNDNAEVTAKTILENGANGYAFNVSNGYRVKWYFREISGDGDILETHQISSGLNGGSQQFIFRDASEFAGNICIDSTSSGNHHTKRYTFSSAKYDNASGSTTYGVIKVLDDGSATIGNGKEWKVDYGITIAGTVTLLGSATMSSSVTISGTTAKLVLADTALTINNTLTFANGAKLTIDPGAIDLTTTATLITGLTNTEAPDVSGITVPGCTVSVGGASGAYTIDAVYKDTSWRGESATWSESSFNGQEIATTGQDVAFILGANGTVTVTLDGTRTPANVVFNGGSTTTYTLTGGTFSPSGTVTVESGSVTIESAATGTYVVNTGATLSLTNATVTSVSGAGTLNIPSGGVVTLASATALDSLTYITGEGELHVGANIPATTLNTLLKKSYTENDATAYYWQGTVVIEDFVQTDATSVGGTTLDCGNASSTIQLKNCTIRYFNQFTTGADLEIVGTVKTLNGSGTTYTEFGKLKGTGSFIHENDVRQLYRFTSGTDFTGTIEVRGRRIVFGTDGTGNDTTDRDTYGNTIRISSGYTATLGAGSHWTAYNGVIVYGTMVVKGANSYIEHNDQASKGIVFNDGATIRFDSLSTLKFGNSTSRTPSVASGSTINIAFGDGVVLGTEPGAEMQLISWGGAPEGDFEFADVSTPKCYRLEKRENGLYLVVKPGTMFTVY